MKRAVFLHGTDGNPEELWWPWLRGEFEKLGYEVYAPLLPNNHTPDRFAYSEFLRKSGWDFKDNILIGHSSGATTVLNLLHEDWLPPISASVLVGLFLNEQLLQKKSPDWYDPSQFNNLFLSDYSSDNLIKKCKQFYFVHGSNDPYCNIEDAKKLCTKVNGTFLEIPNGHHLAGSSGITEIPEMINGLKVLKIIS